MSNRCTNAAIDRCPPQESIYRIRCVRQPHLAIQPRIERRTGRTAIRGGPLSIDILRSDASRYRDHDGAGDPWSPGAYVPGKPHQNTPDVKVKTPTLARMTTTPMPWRHRIAAVAALAAFAGPVLAGCSSDGADVSCSTDACTVTFDRNGHGEADILGIKVKLVDVQNGQARVSVAGNEFTIPVGSRTDVQDGKFSVQVQEVTDTQVVVKVTRGSG
jgi:hypothetical protein